MSRIGFYRTAANTYRVRLNGRYLGYVKAIHAGSRGLVWVAEQVGAVRVSRDHRVAFLPRQQFATRQEAGEYLASAIKPDEPWHGGA